MECRICRNSDENASFDVREMMFGTREVFGYFLCKSCGCLQIAEVPDDRSRYYPADYYSFGKQPARKYRNPLKRPIKRLRDRWAVLGRGWLGRIIYAFYPNADMRKLSPLHLETTSRVLDVGCGNGGRLYVLREIGFENLLGIDAYIETDIEYPNGLKVVKKTIGDVEGAWDCVMFHASFEHMPEPLGTLSRAAALLREGGVCYVRIPLVSSYAWEHYGVNWVQLDAPRHLYLHSTRSFELLAANAGLQVEQVIHDSTAFQFWGSELYAKDIPLKSDHPRSLFSRSRMRAFRKKARELNRDGRGDIASFYLTKRKTE